MKYLLFAILMVVIAFAGNFLIAWGAVALASSCFEFAFAWKYVWFVWFVLSFVVIYFRGESKHD